MKGPGLLLGVGFALVLATAAIGTPADADLWGHLTFGRDMVAAGQIVQAEPYAFTSDRPWVNHEWLTEVSFAEVYRLAGTSGLVLVKLLIIAALLTLVWRYVRPLRPSAKVTVALLTLVFIGTYWRTHTIRPQLFSVLFFAIVVMAMARADQGRRRGLLLVPPLMALWVNFHGGWIVGLGVLGMWTAVRVVDWRIPLRERLALATVGLTAVAATLINPYGVHMWSFLGETVRLGRADIQEWAPVLSRPLALGLPWVMTLAVAGLARWRAGRPQRWDYLAIAALLAFASFRVSRLDAFFTLVVVILLAPEVVTLLGSLDRPKVAAGAGKGPAKAAQETGLIVITVVTVAAMLVPAARIIGPYATCLTFDGAWVPEPEAGRFIQANRLKGRMLTWFDWGQYAIWHFGPDLQVSMDGRRETVYTDATLQAHLRLYDADDTAFSYLRTLNPDYIWLPKRLKVTETLETAGWTAVFDGPVSTVFAPDGTGPFQQVNTETPSRRCFPGP